MSLVILMTLIAYFLEGGLSYYCPERGSRPSLRLLPDERMKPGAILKAECSYWASPESKKPPILTWSLYKKEWGHLEFTLVPPRDRKFEIVNDPNCDNVTTSRLTLTVRERLHRATLACFAHDFTDHPHKCDDSDSSCVQSRPIRVFVKPYFYPCKVGFAAFFGLVAGCLLLFLPMLIVIIWWLSRNYAPSPFTLLEDDNVVLKV